MRRGTMITALFLTVAAGPRPPQPPRVDGHIDYTAANSALGPPRPGEARVVFVGDSITVGWAMFDPAFIRNHAWVGRGVTAETSAQIAARFDADVLALKPAVVHILAGASDLAENDGPVTAEAITANVAAMAERAHAAGAGIVIGSILPARDYPWHRGLNPAPKVVALNLLLRRLATDHRYSYADYHAVLAAADGGMRDGLSRDGVHPTAAGYRVMDPVAVAAITAATPH